MPTYDGSTLARLALREIGVLDPTDAGEDELIEDTLACGSVMIDAWRNDKLLIPAITREIYPLVSGTQAYTIGENGDFDQVFPNRIEAWSVIPDRGADPLIELPMGRPLTWDQWQSIRWKGQASPYPRNLYFDDAWAAGLGNCLFHPIPNTTTVDVALYCAVPELTSLVATTQYNLRPGYLLLIIKNLALEVAERNDAEVSPRLEKAAGRAMRKAKRKNVKLLESPMRADFIIGGGAGRRTFNIYSGGPS